MKEIVALIAIFIFIGFIIFSLSNKIKVETTCIKYDKIISYETKTNFWGSSFILRTENGSIREMPSKYGINIGDDYCVDYNQLN